jgi:PadR family transcriptional regulator, regulatory protein PadR
MTGLVMHAEAGDHGVAAGQDANARPGHVLPNAVYVEAGGVVSPAKSDLPQGTLDMLILQVVALEPIHGYAIAQRLRQISRDVVRVPQGSLYPALHRLENRKVLAAEWKQSESGRDAKYYRLTPKGRAYLKSEAENWERLSVAIRLILRSAAGDAT